MTTRRPSHRGWAIPALLVVLVVVPAGSLAGAPIAKAKPTDPRFAAFDAAMTDFMAARDIHAATLAVANRGEIVWSQGYGTMTRGGTTVVPEDAMFRIASVTKPMMHAAITRLVTERALHPSDPVFCLGQTLTPPLRCHLDIAPPPGTSVDPRMARITVSMLLAHTAGFDRAVSGDPMFKSREISAALGIPGPAQDDDIARYMMGRPLDFTPGARAAYSNFGYVLLELVLEEVTGMHLVEYLKTTLFVDPAEPLRPVPRDLILGRSRPADRDPREPTYNCDGGWRTASVFDGTSVCWADGGFHLEAMEGNGGLVASAPTVAWFLERYEIGGDLRPDAGLVFGAGDWYFYGSLDGTWALARQHSSGPAYVALFNQRWDPSGRSYEDIRPMLDAAVRATSFPVTDAIPR